MFDEQVLDSVSEMLSLDPANMLAATASAGAQIRRSLELTDHEAIAAVAAPGRPRAIVVSGMGGSGISGQVLEAIANTSSPFPVVASRGYGLPAWVGTDDLVISLSCSGSTEETIAAAQEAARRGCRLTAISTPGSALAQFVESVRGATLIGIDAQGRMPRASMWTLLTPLLRVASGVGALSLSERDLEQTADLIDQVGIDCAVERGTDDNPAKLLALQLVNSLPVVWGTGEVGPAAAYRFTSQLAENAKLPAIHGEIPESQHNQVVAFDGPVAGKLDALEGAIERALEAEVVEPERRLRLVLMRDAVESPQHSLRAEIVSDLATSRGVPVSEVAARGQHIVHRFASLIAVTDWASVYAALIQHIDPSPIGPISELKVRLSQSK